MTAATGASALPGVWSFASGRPGPHVMITGLTHGNEPAGLVAISRLLDGGVRPVQGRLTLALVNPEAHGRGRRFIDRDMNRLWRDDWLDDDRASIEAARARTLRPLLREVDALLDLHTTAFVARPFFVLADTRQAPRPRRSHGLAGDPAAHARRLRRGPASDRLRRLCRPGASGGGVERRVRHA